MLRPGGAIPSQPPISPFHVETCAYAPPAPLALRPNPHPFPRTLSGSHHVSYSGSLSPLSGRSSNYRSAKPVGTRLAHHASSAFRVLSRLHRHCIPPPSPPPEYACSTTLEIIRVASTYRSVQRDMHVASPLLRLLPGLTMHLAKHFSRTVCVAKKIRWPRGCTQSGLVLSSEY